MNRKKPIDLADRPLYSVKEGGNIKMGKKHKKSPAKDSKLEQIPISEIDRLEFIIQLNRNSLSNSENEIDEILHEQIEKIKARIMALQVEIAKS